MIANFRLRLQRSIVGVNGGHSRAWYGGIGTQLWPHSTRLHHFVGSNAWDQDVHTSGSWARSSWAQGYWHYLIR